MSNKRTLACNHEQIGSTPAVYTSAPAYLPDPFSDFSEGLVPRLTVLRAATRIVTPYMMDVGVAYSCGFLPLSQGHQHFGIVTTRLQVVFWTVKGCDPSRRSMYGTYWNTHLHHPSCTTCIHCTCGLTLCLLV